jgi:hypothetical protein
MADLEDILTEAGIEHTSCLPSMASSLPEWEALPRVVLETTMLYVAKYDCAS